VRGLSIPPNFERPIPVVWLGSDLTIRRFLGVSDRDERHGVTSHHTVAFATLPEYGPQWIDPGSYDVSIFVTGANFDAKRFDGALTVARVEDSGDRVATTVSWEQELTNVPLNAPRRRRPPTREEIGVALESDRAAEAERRDLL
jgi:hypothetical protein